MARQHYADHGWCKNCGPIHIALPILIEKLNVGKYLIFILLNPNVCNYFILQNIVITCLTFSNDVNLIIKFY